MPEIELRFCPFCGKKAMFIQSDIDSESYVTCSGCFCRTRKIHYSAEYGANERAAEIWNRRVQDEKNKD